MKFRCSSILPITAAAGAAALTTWFLIAARVEPVPVNLISKPTPDIQ